MAKKIKSVIVEDGVLTEGELVPIKGPDGKGFSSLAEAEATLDAVAYAALVEHFSPGNGKDVLHAEAVAEAARSAEARGVSIGDTTGENLVGDGSADLGNGKDTIRGTATTRVTGDGACLRADANGVIVDRDSSLKTGNGKDTIIGSATVTNDVAAGPGSVVVADGIENIGSFDTGNGNDTVVGTGLAQAVGARAIAGGIDNGVGASIGGVPVASVLATGKGRDHIDGSAEAVALGDDAISDGIENAGTIDTGAENDDVKAVAASNAEGGRSIADGIDNRGKVLLGDGNDTVVGRGTANSDGAENKATLAFGVTQVTADVSNAEDDGLFDAGNGSDTVEGVADATGETDVESFGVLFTNATMGEDNSGDHVIGTATADGKDIAQASGVSVGVSNNVPGRDSVLPDEAGTLRTGAGNDSISGTASATTDSGSENLLFNDVDAVLVDLESTLETGAGVDTITGHASAVDIGLGGLTNEDVLSAVVADGVENRGLLDTGSGDDFVSGVASATGANAEAFGIAGGGTIDTGDGKDTVYASSFGEGVQILAGNDEDTVTGFGEATVDGGNDHDRLVFEFDFFGQGGVAEETADGVDFTLDGVTLVSRDFEEFEINGTLFDHGDVLLA